MTNFTVHDTHCTLHTAHCTLHTAQCTLHTVPNRICTPQSGVREDFVSSLAGSPEVDCVITSLEIEEMLGREETRLEDCSPSPLDSVGGQVLVCTLYSASASR